MSRPKEEIMSDENMVIAGFWGPYCTYRLPMEKTSTFTVIRRAQALCALTDIRVDFARKIVREKLQSTVKMMNLLKWNTPLLHQAVQKSLVEIDKTNQIDLFMGIEGSISRKIYAEWIKRLPSELGFSGRNRRPPLDPVNAYISYCNSIVYSLCVPPLAKAGLNTAIGFLHEPGAGRHSLALDMAEGIKPILCEYSLGRALKEAAFTLECADHTAQGCFLNKTGRKVAREQMKNAMLRIFGPSDQDFLGWPCSFWDNMKTYSTQMVQTIVRGKASIGWNFLTKKE